MRIDDSAVDSMNRSCSEEKGEGRAHRIGYGTPAVRIVKWSVARATVPHLGHSACLFQGSGAARMLPGMTVAGRPIKGRLERLVGQRLRRTPALVAPPGAPADTADLDRRMKAIARR